MTALAVVGAALALAAPRPVIAWQPIPFPQARLADTAAYSARHYGQRTWRLTRPQVIVLHATANRSLAATRSTFAANRPDPELRELPGTCTHFVIDRAGRIHQLVRLSIRCRHAVGLNWTAIGVEHVGLTSAEILANRRQVEASLALTRWLMARFEIALGDVIGHNESLESPYHRERYAAWRCRTHADFPRAEMDRYRARIGRAKVNRVDSPCR